MALIYEVNQVDGEWIAGAVDHDGDGEIYIATFDGPKAESLAREYAEWKNAFAVPIQRAS